MKPVESMPLAEVVAEIDDIESIADHIYDVRERAVDEAHPFDGSSWDLPKVKRYGELCLRMTVLLGEAGLR